MCVLRVETYAYKLMHSSDLFLEQLILDTNVDVRNTHCHIIIIFICALKQTVGYESKHQTL